MTFNAPLNDVPVFSSFRDMLLRSASLYPANIALRDLTATPVPRVTHAELAQLVARFGRSLLGHGLAAGDHVAVISENRVQWGLAYLAIVTHGMVAVPIDRNLNENEIRNILRASDSVGAVFSESFRDLFSRTRAENPHLKVLVDMDLSKDADGLRSMSGLIASVQEGDLAHAPETDPEKLAVLVFTSGSMGSAKGVMLTQKNICANLRAMLQMVHIDPTDRFLSVLPIHHTYEGTCGFLCPLVAGGSAHYARSLKTVAEDMMEVAPTVLLGVPLLYEKMYRRIRQAIEGSRATSLIMPALLGVATVLELAGMQQVRRKMFHKVHDRFGGAIRLLIVGGAAPDPQVAKGFRSLGFAFLQGYGLTETSPILAVNRMDQFKDSAAGLQMPCVELRIDAPDSAGRGEILAKGDSVMQGYYKNEEATREVLRDGWFHTGDFGFFDADGFLHINGRKKNVIIARNGENVFPEELEEHVHRLPYVLECVVYGEKVDGDEMIAVMIVPDADAIHDHAANTGTRVTDDFIDRLLNTEIRKLNGSLPVHKQIRKVVLRETEFEKTTTQKIKRYLVHDEDSTH